MMGQQVITWTSTFVLALFLARYLGPLEYGRLFLASSVIAIFRVFVEYGGNYLVAKKVARNPELAGQIVVDATSYRIAFGLLAFAGSLVVACEAGYPPEVGLLITILGLALLWKGAMTALVASYQGLETMQYTSLGSITEAVFVSVTCVTALLMGAKANVIAIFSVTAGFLNFCMLVLFSKKIAASFPRVNWNETYEQIKEGVPYFLLAIFGTIYYRIDSLMLSKMAPEHVVGWYGGAYRLFDVLNFFPYIFTTAIFPVLSRLWGKEEHAHQQITQRSLEFMVIIGIPVCIGAIAFARNAVELLYGVPAYEPSIIVFQVLSSGIVFLFVDMVIGTTLMASNKQTQQSVLALVAIGVNVGMNIFLIPFFQLRFNNGGIGAGLATICTELFIMIAGLALLPKGIFSGFRFSVMFKSAGAGIVMTIFIRFFSHMDLPWFLVAGLCPFVYVPVLLVMKTFDPSEQHLFISMFSVKNLRALVTGNGNA
jgi:O-antigen/teichoic acid export membrane protein